MFEDTNPAQQSEPQIQQEPPAQSPQQPVPQQPVQQQVPQPVPQKPAPTPVNTTQEERMWGAIGYIAFLGVVTLVMQNKSQFCRKHASQGLLIFAVWFLGFILLLFPISIISGLGVLIILGTMGLAIFGVVKAVQSYELNLPVLSDFAKMVPVDAIIGTVTGQKPEQTPTEAQPTPDTSTPMTPPQEESDKENTNLGQPSN